MGRRAGDSVESAMAPVVERVPTPPNGPRERTMNLSELTHPDLRNAESPAALRARLVDVQRALMARTAWPPHDDAAVRGAVVREAGDIHPIIRCEAVLPFAAERLFEMVAVQVASTMPSWNAYVYACREVERLPSGGRVLVDYVGTKGITDREDVFLQCLFRDEGGRLFELSAGCEHAAVPRQKRYVRSHLYFCSKVITPLGADRARYTVYWQYDVAGWLARLMPASTLAKLALKNLEHEFELLAGARIANQVKGLQALPASQYDLFSFERPGDGPLAPRGP